MMRLIAAEEERRVNWAQGTLTGVRTLTHTIGTGDLGLSEFLKKNTIRVQVPDPDNEPRCKVFIMSQDWQNEFYQKQSQLNPYTLILVTPFNDYGYYLMKPDFNKSELNFAPVRLTLTGTPETQLRLNERARSINLNSLGGLNVIKPKYISAQKFGTYIKYGVSQAFIDNINNVESSTCVRDFIPSVDFLDNNGDRIDSFEWIQPPNTPITPPILTGNSPDYSYHISGYQTGGGTDWITLYTTSRNCNNDRKIYFIYGIKNLKFAGIPRKKDEIDGVQASVGGPAEVWLTQLRIMFFTVRLAEVVDMSLLNEYGVIFFQKPILFKRRDDMRIIANVKQGGIGKTDAIKPLGFIVEPLGAL